MKKNNSTITGLLVVALLGILATIVIVNQGNETYAPVSDTFQPKAHIALLSTDITSAQVGQPQIIRWTTLNYPSNTVSINLLKKTSDDPTSYQLIRVITQNAKNDGEGVWVPQKSDMGNDVYIEIGCSNDAGSCDAAYSGSSIAVTNSGKTSNTASVIDGLRSESEN